MMEYAICQQVAFTVSYHRAAEGNAWAREREPRERAEEAWKQCRQWLYEQGQLENFIKSGRYLMFTDSEVAGAKRDHENRQSDS